MIKDNNTIWFFDFSGTLIFQFTLLLAVEGIHSYRARNLEVEIKVREADLPVFFLNPLFIAED